MTAAQASNANGSYKNAYAYDKDRLVQISHNTTGESNDVTHTFGYDVFGKPTTVSVGNGTTSQVLSTNTYDTDRSQKLRKVIYGNGQEVENEYDDFGRLTGRKFSGDAAARYRYWYGANGAAAKTQDNITGWIEWTDHDEANRVNRECCRERTARSFRTRNTATTARSI